MHVELIVAKLITVAIGLTVAATAFRGYRRYGSEPMLYLATGFAVISIGSVIEGVLFDVLHFSIFWAGTVQTSIVAFGMLIVLYSLHCRDTGHTPGELRRSGRNRKVERDDGH
jgi:hypothetical protein